MTDKTIYIYAAQVVFVGAISFGYQGLDVNNANELLAIISRYVFYMVMMKASHEMCSLGLSALQSKRLPNVEKVLKAGRNTINLFVLSIAFLLYNKRKLLEQDFLLWCIADLITKYSDLGQEAPIITYGVGMACSYFEGYLTLVIPSDGASFVGFEGNMDQYAANHGIVFPVKKLFIVVTKSLYCPPDLKHFNKKNREELPFIEACLPLGLVEKDVAGSKNRKYHNSAYKIHRPGKSAVYLAAECVSPLHTLYNVLQKTALYDKLVKADVHRIVNDFCEMLSTIISRSPECRGKCRLIYFDDTDPTQNLADLLLDEIRTLEPNFENITKYAINP